MDDESEMGSAKPSRSEVVEYVHDIAGQLAAMAREAGLIRTADALQLARSVAEAEF